MSKLSPYFLFLDFDGTLAALAPTPSQAHMAPGLRPLLRKMAGGKNLRLAVISGRKLSVLRKKVGLSGIAYAGNHGLEIIGPGGLRFTEPSAKGTKPLLNRLYPPLRKALRPLSGVWVENKLLTLTVHFRRGKPRMKDKVLRIVKELLQRQSLVGCLRLTHGKKVLEIRPKTDWDKGKAVEYLLRLAKKETALRHTSIYIGDDITDYSAFRAVRKRGGLAVCVGREQSGVPADLFLPSPQRLLSWLEEWYDRYMNVHVHNGEARRDPP